MTKLVEYLQKNYYKRYAKLNVEASMLPDDDILNKALDRHTDKLIVVTDKDQIILGVAIFLKLDDATYQSLKSFDMRRVDVLSRLLEQDGENFHIILLAASSGYVIRAGIKELKKMNPKSISWWNPGMTNLHRKQLRS